LLYNLDSGMILLNSQKKIQGEDKILFLSARLSDSMLKLTDHLKIVESSLETVKAHEASLADELAVLKEAHEILKVKETRLNVFFRSDGR
jgi:hypothetical protein